MSVGASDPCVTRCNLVSSSPLTMDRAVIFRRRMLWDGRTTTIGLASSVSYELEYPYTAIEVKSTKTPSEFCESALMVVCQKSTPLRGAPPRAPNWFQPGRYQHAMAPLTSPTRTIPRER